MTQRDRGRNKAGAAFHFPPIRNRIERRPRFLRRIGGNLVATPGAQETRHMSTIRMEMAELPPTQKWAIVMAGLLVLCIGSLLCFSFESYLILKKKELASNASHQMTRQLDRHLNESLFATYALAALIKSEHGNIAGFDGLAKEFIAYQPHIASLQLAPAGVVQHIVPLAGNEKAIGHNLLTDEKRNTEARLALQTKKLTLAGPVELRQGGVAVIGRLPVFLDDTPSGFWGFTTALIKIKDFLNTVQIDGLAQQGFAYELWRIQPGTAKKQLIAQSATALYGEPTVSHLDVPNGRWYLSLTPVEGWANPTRNALEALAIVALSLICCWLTFIFFRERHAVDRMKSEFVSTVSHELRTPLTAISGSLGLITGGAVGDIPAQAKAMIVMAHKNSLRLIHLINDLLDMEKLIAGKMHFEMQSYPLMPLLEAALETMRPYGAGYGVSFVLSARVEPARVVVDELRLQQVLNNFLANAAKFSPAGEQVELAAFQVGQRVRVEVKDRGPGIPAQFRSRIFQKFSQADSSDARQKGGTGLGLAISMEIIERMHGVIGFESEENQGACFYFELPLDDLG
jgi:signal transduction histidine kinase